MLNVSALLIVLLQAVLISAANKVTTNKLVWSKTYTETYSTEINVVAGFLGFFGTTSTTYQVHVPGVYTTKYVTSAYTDAKATGLVTYSTGVQSNVGTDGSTTVLNVYNVKTPVRASSTTAYSYGTYSGTATQTSTVVSTVTSAGLETVVTYFNIALPTDSLKTTTTAGWEGSATTTNSKTVSATDAQGLNVQSTIIEVLTPRPSGVISYVPYSGSTTNYFSTTVDAEFGFKNFIFGLWYTTTYLVNVPYNVVVSTTTVGAAVTAIETISTSVYTIPGENGFDTTVTYYIVGSPIPQQTSTAYTQGTQTGVTLTLGTSINYFNGTDGFQTTETVYSVAVPTHIQKSTTFEFWPSSFITTYATDIQTTVGSDGSSTAQTVFYVYTPREEGVTSFVPYTGSSTVFYSTIVNTNFGFSGLLFGAWETTTYLVNTPIRNSIETVTLGTNSQDLQTAFSLVTTTTGADLEATTITFYFVAQAVQYQTSTQFTQGTQTDKAITYSTGFSVVNGTDGTLTSETIYSVAIPTTFHQTTSFVEGGKSVATISTEYTTVTGTDGKATEETLFLVQTPRHPGIYSNIAYNGTVTTVFSTSVDYNFGFENLIFGLWSTSYYFVHTPSRVSTDYSTKGFFGNTTRTYSTEVYTTTGSDAEATTVSVLLVQTPIRWEKTTVLSQGTQTAGEVTYGTATNTVTGTDGELTTVTTYSVALPTHFQETVTFVEGTGYSPTIISTSYTTVIGSDNIPTATTVYYVATHKSLFADTTTATWDKQYTSTDLNREISWGFVGFLFAPWIIEEYTVYVPAEASTSAFASESTEVIESSILTSTEDVESYIPTSSSVYESVTESYVGSSSFLASVSGTVSVLSGYVSYTNGTIF